MPLHNTPGTVLSGTCVILPVGDGKAGIGSDATTGEHGFLVKLVNRTGGASVKGTLISASTSADGEAIKQANEYDTIGAVQQAGVAEGAEMYVWCNGSVAQVLYKDSVAAVRGNILLAGADGRGACVCGGAW